MVNRKTASALTIAALLTCAIPMKSVASLATPVIAQSAPSFPVPDKADETVRVSSSSDNMNSISKALASGFEGKYEGEVEIETKSVTDALADVLNGSADVAAISRPLTATEKEQGLVEVPVRREKIAIIVGEDNPFSGSITSGQFAQIFRGEIKNWSEVGGANSPIRVVDRPAASETRQALQPYPVFASQALATGDNATQISEDSTGAIAKELGADGISYALVGEVGAQSEIRAIELHKTLPNDPRYPFSQPYSFVYADDASPAAAAFLGYATGGEGQAALQSADLSGYGVAPAAGEGSTGTKTAIAEADGSKADSSKAGGTKANGANAGGADGGSTGADNASSTAADGGIGKLNDAGQLVDAENNLINPEGFLINADGNLIDADGNLLPAGAAGVPGVGINLNGIGDGVGSAIEGAGGAAGEAVGGVGDAVDGALAGRGRWWWLLLPLAGLGLLIWAAGKRGSEEEAGYSATARGTTDDRVRNSFRGKMPNVNTPDTSLPKTNLSTANLSSTNLPKADLPRVGVDSNLGTANAANLGAAELDGIKTSVGNAGNKVSGIGKAGLAGAAGLAGGAAAGAAGLAGQMKGKANDVTASVGRTSDSLKDGVNNVKGTAADGLDGLRSNTQGRIDSTRTHLQGGIDGARTHLQGNVQGHIDGLKEGSNTVQGRMRSNVSNVTEDAQRRMGDVRSDTQGSFEGVRNDVQSRVDDLRGSVNPDKSGMAQGSSWLDRAKQRINEAAEGVKDTASDIKDDLNRKD